MTRVSRRVPAFAVAGVLLALGMLAGCSDDEGDGGVVGPGPSPITVREILFSPGSVEPTDTLLVTAVVVSDSPNVGDFVTYNWALSGGEWIDTERSDKSSVRWRAPADPPGLYTFTVTATNSAGSSTLTAQVFVGRLEMFIAERAGQLFTFPGSEAVYYTSAPDDPDSGYALRLKDGAGDEVAFPNHRGSQFSFDKSGTREAHTYVETTLYEKTTVVYDDLVARTHKTVARDDRTFAVRWNAYTNPYLSQDGDVICYQGGLLDRATPAQGGVDTFAVFVYEVAKERTRRATFRGNSISGNISNSFQPTISSDGRHVVFISDRQAPGVWEYYALPIEQGEVVPDTIPDALINLTATGGAVASDRPIPAPVASHWNPDPGNPALAAIGADKVLRLLRPGASPAAVDVSIDGDVGDVRWEPNGSFLVASATGPDNVDRVYRISASGGASQVVWTAEIAGDRIRELSVSPDGGALVYSVKRGSKSWYELVDVNREAEGPPAVRISPSVAVGPAALYGLSWQSFRPVWDPDETRVAYLLVLDKETPRAMVSRDLSAIGD
jgi:hypothetical protein